MSESICDRENELLAALSTGQLSGSQQQHLEGCASCSEAIEVAKVLAELSKSGTANSLAFPSAAAIWAAAEFDKQRELRKRFKFIQFALGSGALLASVIISVIFWSLKGFGNGTEQPSLSPLPSISGQGAVAPVIVLATLFLAISLLLRVVNLSRRSSDSA